MEERRRSSLTNTAGNLLSFEVNDRRASVDVEGFQELLQGEDAYDPKTSVFKKDSFEALSGEQQETLTETIKGQCFQISIFILCIIVGAAAPLMADLTKTAPEFYTNSAGEKISCSEPGALSQFEKKSDSCSSLFTLAPDKSFSLKLQRDGDPPADPPAQHYVAEMKRRLEECKLDLEGEWSVGLHGVEAVFKDEKKKGCKKTLPYHPTVELLAESAFSLTLALTVVSFQNGKEGLRSCFDIERLKMTAPIAVLYALGDLVQLLVIGGKGAAFFMVVKQLQMLIVGLMTKLILGRNQTNIQWLLLVAITLAVILFCVIDMSKKQTGASDSTMALALSLFKCVLSSFVGVLLERALKAGKNESIWVNQVQLKVVSVPAAVFFMILKGMVPGFCKENCIQNTGMFKGFGGSVFLLILVQSTQNVVVGLVYKKVNAIIKVLANAQSLWVTYVLSTLIAGQALGLDMCLIVVLVVILVILFGFAKSDPAKQPTPVSYPVTPSQAPGTVEMGQPNAGRA